MYSKVLVFSGLLAVAFSAAVPQKPQQQPEPVQIVSQDTNVDSDGNFHWNFESADGTKQEQAGEVKQVGEKDVAIAVQGQASWTDNEGKPHQLTYVADETGYHPQSDDVPVAPEIPAAIARALQWIAEHPQPENQQQ